MVLRVRVGKPGPGSEYQPRRVVLSKTGPDSCLRYFQKESKRANGAVLMLRRTIFFRDINEIQLSRPDGPTTGASLRIEVVTVGKSRKSNIGLEFPDMSSFEEWHAALYSRWLQCSNNGKSKTSRIRRSGSHVPNETARESAVDLSTTFFGLLAEYKNMVRRRKLSHQRGPKATSMTDVVLQIQKLHQHFVHSATVAAQRIIESTVFDGLVTRAPADKLVEALKAKTRVSITQDNWPLTITVTAWDPSFKSARNGHEKWKLEGHVRFL